MSTRAHHIILGGTLATVLLMVSCSGDPNSPGVEYMPDMYRSPAVEAYVDYGQDPYTRSEELAREQRERPSARKPVAGTVAFSMDPSKAQYNMPYPYPNTPEGYERAGAELKAPLEVPMTEANVEKGKAIYVKFCQHCHGEKGSGDGSVVANGNYPPPPPYDGPALKDLPEGKIFHSIHWGRNVAMGSHASQLNKEERWLATRYVQYLQNGGKMTREGAAAPEAVPPPAASPLTAQ